MADSDSRTPTDAIDTFRRRAYRHAVEDGAIDLVVGLILALGFLATAGVLMAVGAATMTRFVRSRPIVSEETPNGR
jgi:hypothetical protein